VPCPDCSAGTLGRGGYVRKNPLPKKLIGSKWTAAGIDPVLGWRHFSVDRDASAPGATGRKHLFARLRASCDPSARIWVSAQLLRDRTRWAAGWLRMDDVVLQRQQLREEEEEEEEGEEDEEGGGSAAPASAAAAEAPAKDREEEEQEDKDEEEGEEGESTSTSKRKAKKKSKSKKKDSSRSTKMLVGGGGGGVACQRCSGTGWRPCSACKGEGRAELIVL
jgi:tryptophan-rich hypothetical protein